MKTTIHILLTAILLALPLASQNACAQDEDNSIIGIVTRMPAETVAEFDSMMQVLSADGKKTVEILAGMLVPSTEGQNYKEEYELTRLVNSKIEYALNGLVAYVSAEGRETLAEEVRSGLCSAIDACTDKVNKAFLMTLLQLIGTEDDAPIYVKYLNDEYLKPFAISGLTAIQPDGEKVRELLKIQHLMDSDNSHERFEGLYLLLHSGEASPQELVLEALKDSDREYRAAALMEANDFADEAFYSEVGALVAELGDEAKADVVNWFGDNHVASQSGVVVKETASQNPELAKTAIKAAGKIGGEDALEALAACLDGPHGKEAVVALTSLRGDVTNVVVTALNGSPKTQVLALELAGARHITAATPKVFELTEAIDGEVSKAAYKALAGVCTTNDFDKLCTMLDNCDEENAPAVRAAIVVSVRELPIETVTAVKEAAWAGSGTAFFALLNIHADLTADLLALAGHKEEWKDNALSRMSVLMDEYVPAAERAAVITKGLALQPSANVQKKLLTVLGDSYDPVGIDIALGYIDEPEMAEAAAYAIKTIVGKNPSVLSEDNVRTSLVKARDVYSVLSASDADAGYAVDEINGLLAK